MMVFTIPTLTELIARVETDVDSKLSLIEQDTQSNNNPLQTSLDKYLSNLIPKVLVRAFAGLCHTQLGFINWMVNQWFVHLCDETFLPLHAVTWNVPRKPATKATGTVTVQGISGTIVPIGTRFQRTDGTTVTTTVESVLGTGSTTLSIEAETVGIAGNIPTGTVLQLVNPIAGLINTATVVSLTGGAEIENVLPWRNRILYKIQNPPKCGHETDYQGWALEVAGVTRAWAVAWQAGTASVSVRFMMDDTYANGIPQSGDIATVDAYIRDGRKPVGAFLLVEAPIAQPVNFTIALTPDTTTVRSSVVEALNALILQASAPGATLRYSQIREAIATAIGEDYHTLVSPTADVAATSYQHIHTLGTITWVTV